MAQMYRLAPLRMMNKEVDWVDDDIRATLHSAAYVPSLDTHDYVNDLTNELATGGGYTTNGVALASKQITYTAGSTWATARANGTAYTLFKIVRPASANGYVYYASVGGTSGGTIPTFPTVIGATVADGAVTWTCAGRGVVVVDAADVTWPTATFTGVRYLVISDRTPGTTATRPLIAIHDFGSNVAGSGGAFTHSWENPDGIFNMFMP